GDEPVVRGPSILRPETIAREDAPARRAEVRNGEPLDARHVGARAERRERRVEACRLPLVTEEIGLIAHLADPDLFVAEAALREHVPDGVEVRPRARTDVALRRVRALRDIEVIADAVDGILAERVAHGFPTATRASVRDHVSEIRRRGISVERE